MNKFNVIIQNSLTETKKLRLTLKSIKYSEKTDVVVSIPRKYFNEDFSDLKKTSSEFQDFLELEINKQLYFSHKGYEFKERVIIAFQPEPMIHWKLILKLSVIPIVLFSALPSFFETADFNFFGFFALLRYGFWYFFAYLHYVAFVYFLAYGLWAYQLGFKVRIERAVNRIFGLAIFAMSYSVIVDFSGRNPSQIEKITIMFPYIEMNQLDWEKFDMVIERKIENLH